MSDYRWEDGVLRGGGPYYTAATLVRFIQSGSAQSLFEASMVAARHAAEQRDLAEDAYELVGLLESAWSGEASDAARDKIRSFAAVTDETASTLTRNEQNLQVQIDNFDRLKSSLEPIPEREQFQRQIVQNAVQYFAFDDLAQQMREYESKVARNIQTYNAYWEQTDRNFSTLSYDYGELHELNDNTTVAVDNSKGSGVPGGWLPPDYNPLDDVGPRDAGEDLEPLDEIPDVGTLDDSTSASSFTNPNGTAGTGGVPGGIGAGSGPAAGTGAGVGSGGLSGTGAGAGADLGAGKSTGATTPVPGGAGAGAARAAAAGGGVGRGGMGGMGMMGGAGGQGKGGEDEEYKRKGWLQENDADNIFGLDEKTTPPVIGAD